MSARLENQRPSLVSLHARKTSQYSIKVGQFTLFTGYRLRFWSKNIPKAKIFFWKLLKKSAKIMTFWSKKWESRVMISKLLDQVSPKKFDNSLNLFGDIVWSLLKRLKNGISNCDGGNGSRSHGSQRHSTKLLKWWFLAFPS